MYNSRFTSTLIVEATKAEIESYAKNEMVDDISLFVDVTPKSEMHAALRQINADDITGTKSINFNNGSGYKGTGVRIGIIEAANAVYDENATQLADIHNVRLFKPTTIGTSSPTVGAHATLVTSIIVGQSASHTYQFEYEEDHYRDVEIQLEGILPFSTAYQIGLSDHEEDIQALVAAPYFVNVINYSIGHSDNAGYDNTDKEFDRIIANTSVSLVKSAGNNMATVSAPGRALNLITVGAAETKADKYSPYNDPYRVSFFLHT